MDRQHAEWYVGIAVLLLIILAAIAALGWMVL